MLRFTLCAHLKLAMHGVRNVVHIKLLGIQSPQRPVVLDRKCISCIRFELARPYILYTVSANSGLGIPYPPVDLNWELRPYPRL